MCSGRALRIATIVSLAAVSLAVLATQPAAAQGFGGFRGNAIGGAGNIGRASPGIGRIGPAPGQLNIPPSGGSRFPGVNQGGGGPSNIGRPRPSRLPGEPGVVVGRPGGSVVVPHDDEPVAAKRGRKPRKQISAKPSGPKGGAPSAAGAARAPGGAARLPPTVERGFVPDEVLVETDAGLPEAMLSAIARRHRLIRLASFDVDLLGSRLHRWRIADRRAVPAVIAALANERALASVQTNNVFTLDQGAEADTETKEADAASPGDPAQYVLAKLRVDAAHRLAKGHDVLVAVIDSAVDTSHPDLAHAIAGIFDAIDSEPKPHPHGTAVAGAIASHGRLKGVAPSARILAVRAFDGAARRANSTTFAVVKGLDWSAQQGARVVNMSFSGPSADSLLRRSLAAARQKGLVLVAAAGNAGAKSPPLYPAADPSVIAVTATDANDNLFPPANRGRHVAVSAPGVGILAPALFASYEYTSGTSIAAAHVSGIAALMIERNRALDPDAVRDTLLATARDLGPRGRDEEFGAGLADAFAALTAPSSAERATAGTR
jgi:Subtilase family